MEKALRYQVVTVRKIRGKKLEVVETSYSTDLGDSVALSYARSTARQIGGRVYKVTGQEPYVDFSNQGEVAINDIGEFVK